MSRVAAEIREADAGGEITETWPRAPSWGKGERGERTDASAYLLGKGVPYILKRGGRSVVPIRENTEIQIISGAMVSACTTRRGRRVSGGAPELGSVERDVILYNAL